MLKDGYDSFMTIVGQVENYTSYNTCVRIGQNEIKLYFSETMNPVVKNIMRAGLLFWFLSQIVQLILQPYGLSLEKLLGVPYDPNIKPASILPMFSFAFVSITIWEIIVAVYSHFQKHPKKGAETILDAFLSIFKKVAN